MLFQKYFKVFYKTLIANYLKMKKNERFFCGCDYTLVIGCFFESIADVLVHQNIIFDLKSHE